MSFGGKIHHVQISLHCSNESYFSHLLWSIHIDGSVQERRNSSVLAMELRLSCIDPSMYCLSLETKGPNIAIVVVKFVQFWRKPNNVQVCSISFVDDVYNVQSSCGRFWGISLNLASSPGQMSFRAWGCKFIDGVRGNESGLWHVIYWMKVPHLIWHRLRNVFFFLQKMRFHEKFCLGSLTSVMKLPPCCRRCRKNS